MEFFYDLDVIHFVTKDVSLSLDETLCFNQECGFSHYIPLQKYNSDNMKT